MASVEEFDCDELSRVPWKKNGELNFEEPPKYYLLQVYFSYFTELKCKYCGTVLLVPLHSEKNCI